MPGTYRIARNNRYWHLVGEGSRGSVEPEAVDRDLHREGPREELSRALEAGPTPRWATVRSDE